MILGFFRNRKLKRELKKKREIKLVSIIKSEIKSMNDKAEEYASAENSRNRKWDSDHNEKCPKCRSKNVNDRIKRQQGSIDGEISGSGWSALSFGRSSLYGSIKGKLDTNEVNKCNDCSHEWKKYESEYVWRKSVIDDWCNSVRRYLEKKKKIDEMTYDPLDVKEEYASLEEKIAAEKKDLDNYYVEKVKKHWSGISINTLNKMCEQAFNNYQYEDYAHSYNEKYLLEVGFRKITDEELEK